MSRKLLIFDLDETLVHAVSEPLEYDYHFEVGPYKVYLRPHVKQLLDYCSQNFDIAVWSSSSEKYVESVVENVFGEKYPLKFSWAVNRCVQKPDPSTNNYVYIKDLRKVRSQGYLTEQILIVDDSPEKVQRQPKNLIRIQAFEGDSTDTELLSLIERLKSYA